VLADCPGGEHPAHDPAAAQTVHEVGMRHRLGHDSRRRLDHAVLDTGRLEALHLRRRGVACPAAWRPRAHRQRQARQARRDGTPVAATRLGSAPCRTGSRSLDELGAHRGGDVAKAVATKCPPRGPPRRKPCVCRAFVMRRRGLEPPPGYPGPGPQPGNPRVRSVHFASERPPSCAGADDMDWSGDLDVATDVAARARRRCTSAPRWTDRTCRVPMYVVVASRDERSLPRAGVSSAPATGDRISS
jgi:hypothetical protein